MNDRVMRKMLLIDCERCTGCEICVLYCSFEKTRTFNRTRSRVSIIRWEEEELYIPTMCQQCEEAPCILACPVDALSKDEVSGVVCRNDEVCIGCKMCITICPFVGSTIDPVENKVISCDLCGGNPICAKVCPTGAIQYVRADRIGIMKKGRGLERLAKLVRLVVGEPWEVHPTSKA